MTKKELESKPQADCYCAKCEHFTQVGYMTVNQDSEAGLGFGYCFALGKELQECDFCSKAMRRGQ